MNIDKDFRYVSPLEFLEFVPEKDRNSKYTKDGYPLGYYHRTKAFQRGGNIAKTYAKKKKSIIVIGNFIFVHGGLSRDLMNKYTIAQILDAWEAAYGEDMMTEYPGFIQRLSEENASQVSNPDKGTDEKNKT